MQLNEKVQRLSQYNPDLATFTDSYDIISCMQVNPIVDKILVPTTLVVSEMMEVVTPVSVLVPTGKQFAVQTEN